MPATTESEPRRSQAVKLAAGLVAVQTVALIGYIIAIALASRQSRGSSMTATTAEIIVYAAFAALMAWLAWGLWRPSPFARTPMLVTQAFILIIGYTVFSGGTTATTITGVIIMLVALAGLVLGFSPALVAGLYGEQPSDN